MLHRMPGREFIGQGKAPARREGWNPDELHTHVRGRAEASIRILIAVASLRARNLLPANASVSTTGARWQDWKGTREQPRAHRFPCNPQIANRDLPGFAPNPIFRQRLQDVLAITDFLPFHVNYADRLFEEFGGVEEARKAVAQVQVLQKPGQSPDFSVVHKVWSQSLHAGYVRAWDAVERKLLDRVNRENAIKMLERIAGFRSNAPTDSIETVQDVAYDAKRSTELVSSPSILSQPGFQSYLRELT
jgi:hypothetical protein